MRKDNYDLEVTCSSDAALQSFLAGLSNALSLDQSGIDEFEDAIAQDDEFALAHAALARQFFIHGQSGASARHFEVAIACAGQVTARECSAIEITAAGVSGDPQATARAHTHIQEFPQDIFVLSQLVGPFSLLAFSGNPDWGRQCTTVLDDTRRHYSDDDWWHLTSRGFFAAESGELAQSRTLCERAWSIKENGNCAHSLAHLHFEACAIDEGRAFIDEWVNDYGGESEMRHHLIWHACLLALENGAGTDEVLSIYAQELDDKVCDPTPLETLSDNASLLWRCFLSGAEIPQSIREGLFKYIERKFGHTGFAFADLHRSIGTALNPEDSHHTKLENALREVAEKSESGAAICVQHTARAIGAFVNQDYISATETLEPILTDTVLLGGSNPQRRIIEETYVEACIRAKKHDAAIDILRKRNRPQSRLDQNLLQRCNA